MTNKKTLTLMTLGLTVLAAGCDASDPMEDSEQRGGLLFGLGDVDVEQIHAEYLEGEDIQLSFDRLAAPFDCDPYGDLCELIGPAGAETLTGEVVEMALEGVAVAEIDAHIDLRVEELREEFDGDAQSITLRGAGLFAQDTSPNQRSRIRTNSGIWTPAVGQRRAWTQVQAFSRPSTAAPWAHASGTLCLILGDNTQIRTTTFDGGTPFDTLLESEALPWSCQSNVHEYRTRTFHDRNNTTYTPPAPPLGGFTRSFTISSEGSAVGVVNGFTLEADSPGRTETF